MCYSDAIILYVCVAKKYGSATFDNNVDYFASTFDFNAENYFDECKCNKLGIDYYAPVFPWEEEEDQINILMIWKKIFSFRNVMLLYEKRYFR